MSSECKKIPLKAVEKQSLPFTEYDFYDSYQKTFEGMVLGRMKKVLPLREMADTFGLVSKRQVPKRGAKPYFSTEGKVRWCS